MEAGKGTATIGFTYRAQSTDGATLTGTLDALDEPSARGRLSSLGLTILELAALPPNLPEPRPAKTARLGTLDFAAFNQQLAQLTRAGMPVESGLKLIAADMRTRKLRAAVEAVAHDLERGVPLPEAFESHSRSFPKLYGHVLRAGIAAGNLPAVLLNLGRHLELMQRLRRNLWRAASYPLMVLVAMCGVLTFVGYVLEGPMNELYSDDFFELPRLTQALFFIGRQTPFLLLFLAWGVFVFWLIWRFWQRKGYEQRFVDRWLSRIPLLGRVIRSNLIARWCGAVSLGVEAGLDLPHAIELGAQATGSQHLANDGKRILVAHEHGEPLQSAGHIDLIPPSVLTAMEFGKNRGDLPNVLRTLTQMYQEKSEHHLATLIAILSPAMLILVGVTLVSVIYALFLPMAKLVKSLSQ